MVSLCFGTLCICGLSLSNLNLIIIILFIPGRLIIAHFLGCVIIVFLYFQTLIGTELYKSLLHCVL